MKNHSSPLIKKFPTEKQRLLDKLLDKNRDGALTPREKTNLKRLVAEAERLMVANSKRLAKFARM